jgi:hypothetical protein
LEQPIRGYKIITIEFQTKETTREFVATKITKILTKFKYSKAET